MEIICFYLGITFGLTYYGWYFLAALALFFISLRPNPILFFVLGWTVAFCHLYSLQPTGMPNSSVIPRALVRGVIHSIPIQNPHKTQFEVEIQEFNQHPAQANLQLSWYNDAPKLHAGEHWQFLVKLKKPHDYANPGSYSYERTLATRHVTWTGYILGKNENHQLMQNTQFNLLQLRENFANYLMGLSPNHRVAGILEALTINLTTHIAKDDWELFRRTGTIHLIGISGEHVTLISGILFFLVRILWSRSVGLCLRVPSIYPASLAGLFIAFIYSLLAGFAPPVQRALVGCFFYTVYCLGKQRLSAWQVWRYAMFAILCFEPHAVFMQGFYFSFLAVACLLLTQQRWPLQGFKASLGLQLSCLIGLMPLSLYWYAYGSVNGFIANMITIPLVGLLIVPLALLLLIIPCALGKLVIIPLAFIIDIFYYCLKWCEQFAFLNLQHSLTSWTIVLGSLLALILWPLLPISAFRSLTLLFIGFLFFPPRPIIAPGTALIRTLDVGQGLAVSIQTAHHVLLYDTGDLFFKGDDLGKRVILPYYLQMGVKQIDKVVISHPDKDHRGGLKSVEQGLPVQQLLVNDRRYYHRGLKCHDQQPWEWDGVTFRFFPIKKSFKSKNNASCILQVRTQNSSFLLTGDIEQPAEDYLMRTYGRQLRSTLLLIPHHGSKTSSSYRFLMEVAPQYALVSLGLDNRFHFPHDKTLASLRSLGIPLYRTDECGMLDVVIDKQGAQARPHCYRQPRQLIQWPL